MSSVGECVTVAARVQSSVERLTQDKVDLEASLELEEEAFINNLVRQLSGFMQNYQAMDRVRAPALKHWTGC